MDLEDAASEYWENVAQEELDAAFNEDPSDIEYAIATAAFNHVTLLAAEHGVMQELGKVWLSALRLDQVDAVMTDIDNDIARLMSHNEFGNTACQRRFMLWNVLHVKDWECSMFLGIPHPLDRIIK